MAKKGMARPDWTKRSPKNEAPISDAHGPIDNDLAKDNLEKNIPYADLQDLK